MVNWQDIADRHGPAAWSTAYRLLRNDQDAADCLQEAFLNALEVSRRQAVRNWRGLLVRLVTARALDCLRGNRARSRRRDHEPDWTQLAGKSPTPPDAVTKNELAPRLRTALARLPARQAEMFCLRFLDDMSYEEIAEQMGISADNVGVQIHRARQGLREMLLDHHENRRIDNA